MVCGPIGRGFDPLYLPIFFFQLKALLNETNSFFSVQKREINFNFVMWQEGLFIDFLQKKMLTNVLQNIIINSFSIFNEKFFFDPITRFFLLIFINPLNTFFFYTTPSLHTFFWYIFLLLLIFSVNITLIVIFLVL